MTQAMLIPFLFTFTLLSTLAIAVWQLVSVRREQQNRQRLAFARQPYNSRQSARHRR